MAGERQMIDAATLIENFIIRFQATPTHRIFAPGRVNLIGEHTDYNMLPVLPMAMDQGLHLLVRAVEGRRIRIQNLDPKYPPIEFEASNAIPRGPAGEWGNYVRAAVQHAWPRLAELLGREPQGFDALIDSDLPPAAGLSSSSATVVGAYLAFCAANGARLRRDMEPEELRLAERYVGTASGGMDQATILLARAGKALLIDFDPLRTQEIPLPDEIVFFAVDSLQRAAKSGGARFEYNRRTFECQCALELTRRFVLSAPAACNLTNEQAQSARGWVYLRDLLATFDNNSEAAIACLRAAIRPEARSLDQLRQRLSGTDNPVGASDGQTGMSVLLPPANAVGAEGVPGGVVDSLLHSRMLPDAADRFWSSFEGFYPLQRATHVLAEADRVRRCATALASNDIDAAAQLISASHTSCRDLYQISTPIIEQLITAAMTCDARAARITGAGFGGAIVAMVASSEAGEFSNRLWYEYFKRLPEDMVAGISDQTCILKCEPGDGARIEVLTLAPSSM